MIVPSFIPDGPMKGAVSLCNGLAGKCDVRIVSINESGRSVESEIDAGVERIKLEDCGTWWRKVHKLKSRVRDARRSGNVTLISFSLKADIMNLAVGERVKHISSVRGNLLINYRYDYGWKGVVAAIAHFQIMRLFDVVVSMSDSMTNQLQRYGVKKIEKIGNFIDEKNMERKPEGHLSGDREVRFIFLGSLTKRKRPELAVKAVIESIRRGGKCRLDMVGDGPIRERLEDIIMSNGAGDFIKLHGYVDKPQQILADCDYMVLPSESEGISRAVMEALHFNVPCILRDVDGNRELIKEGINGHLFLNDDEFIELVWQKAGNEFRRQRNTQSLLPGEYRQDNCIHKYMELLG